MFPRRRRATGGVADLTPPRGERRPSRDSSAVDPLLARSWDELEDERAQDAWPEWLDEVAVVPGPETLPAVATPPIDQNGLMVRRRDAPVPERPPTFEELVDPESLDREEPPASLALADDFVPHGGHARALTAGLPESRTVRAAAAQGTTSAHRLDPYQFDPSGVLASTLGWFVGGVESTAAAGFEALVFWMTHDRHAFVELVVPSALQGWTFEGAVSGLADRMVRRRPVSETVVGRDAAGCVVAVVALHHLDLFAVRVSGTSHRAAAVALADRYADQIDDGY